MTKRVWLGFLAFFSVLSVSASTPSNGIDPVLKTLLQFHPAWITRSVTSHDGTGGNGDGSWNGNKPETLDGIQYKTLFHGMGEGRILRLWMTADYQNEMPDDYQELRIEVDGETLFQGKPLDFFNGQGEWKYPLVMGFGQTSGALLSYVPIPYTRDAKILFLGDPHYFQVTYRQGQGSSEGPSAEEVSQFMSDRSWVKDIASGSSVSAKSRPAIATGAVTVSGVSLDCAVSELSRLRVRMGSHPAVPAAFFFGLGSTSSALKGQEWAEVHSEINDVSLAGPRVRLVTRLPIPLQSGESLTFESTSGDLGDATYSFQTTAEVFQGVHLDLQFYDQWAPGNSTTMRFYESQAATQFVSLVEEISDGPQGSQRRYLEGDEMIRTDQMSYPLQLGTGTEDYFNGGWYFAMGAFTNPNSGEPRFNVIHPEDGWKNASFEHSLYRHHVFDPVVGRSGIRFGFEAGDTGDFAPVRYKTLATAYRFDSLKTVEAPRMAIGGPEGTDATSVVGRFDSEFNQSDVTFNVYSTAQTETQLKTECPAEATGLLLTRTYDAAAPVLQAAIVSVKDRDVGTLFEAYSNPARVFAQDSIWIDLMPGDCSGARGNGLVVTVSPLDDVDEGWNAVNYGLQFFNQH